MNNFKLNYSAIFPILIMSLFFVVYIPIKNNIINDFKVTADPSNHSSLDITISINDSKKILNTNYLLIYNKKGDLDGGERDKSIKDIDSWVLFAQGKDNIYGGKKITAPGFEIFIDGTPNHRDGFFLETINYNESSNDKNSGKIEFSNLMKVALVFILSLILFLFSEKKINYKILPLMIFIFICFVSAFVSSESMLSFKRSLMIFVPTMLIVYHYSNYYDVDKLVKQFTKFFLVFTFLLCLYSFIVFYFDESINLTTKNFNNPSFISNKFIQIGQFYSSRNFYEHFFMLRPSSLLPNTIGFSHVLLISFILSINNFQNTKKSIYIFLIFIFGLFLFWTMSRITILCVLAVIPLFVFNKKINIKLYSITIIIITIIYIPALVFVKNEFSINVVPRIKLYDSIIQEWRDFWLYGFGGFAVIKETFLDIHMNQIIKNYFEPLNNFKIIDPGNKLLYHPSIQSEIDEFKNLSVSSVPLTLIVEIGIIGFISFITIFLIPIFQIENLNKNNGIILIVFFGIYLTQLFDISLFRFHPITFLTAFLIGLLCNSNFRNEEK